MEAQDKKESKDVEAEILVKIEKSLDEEWIIVKEEYQIDEEGEFKRKSYVKERKKATYWGFEKKDAADFLLRIVAMVSIFIPVLIFFLHSWNEDKKEERKHTYEIQAKVLSEIFTCVNSPVSSIEHKNASANLFSHLYADVKILENPSIENAYSDLLVIFNCYEAMKMAKEMRDSLYSQILFPIYDKLSTHSDKNGHIISNQKEIEEMRDERQFYFSRDSSFTINAYNFMSVLDELDRYKTEYPDTSACWIKLDSCNKEYIMLYRVYNVQVALMHRFVVSLNDSASDEVVIEYAQNVLDNKSLITNFTQQIEKNETMMTYYLLDVAELFRNEIE